MYQKIVIENFGPVAHAEIKICPWVVIIGEQASGKSTIAKLIYFFQQIPSEFLSRYYASDNRGIDLTHDVLLPIRDKFYDFFGSTSHLPDFTITYHYDEHRSITLTLNEKKRVSPRLSDNFFSKEDRNELRGYKIHLLAIKDELDETTTLAQRVALEKRQVDILHNIADKINDIFSVRFDDSLFILAGRNATIGYSETFEDLLKQGLRKKLEEQVTRSFETKTQTTDETLLLGFLDRVVKMRQSYIKLGNFEGMVSMIDKQRRPLLSKAHSLINHVIRGQYVNSAHEERIVLPDGRYVYLKDASSGQQEVIRILQDAFLSIYQGNKVFRIVEEPEAHLYPVAQMYTIQLLSLMLNALPGSNLITTTHSPYTLTVINNLLMASKIGNAKPDETDRIISKELWLSRNQVAAYCLSKGRSESIIDEGLGEIKAELIDEVSSELNRQYDMLLDLEEYEDPAK